MEHLQQQQFFMLFFSASVLILMINVNKWMFADEEQSQLREEQSHLRRGHEKQDQIPDEEESSGAVSWLLTRV